jgi:hypothetical protein
MLEYFFQCPYCWEEISMLMDTSVSSTYVEDCEVCCNPIEITTQFFEGELQIFSAHRLE